MTGTASTQDMTGTNPDKNGEGTARRILVVEDEETLAAGVREALERQQYSVETCADGQAGLERIREGGLDLVILDLMLPKMGGLDVLKHLRAEGRDVRVVILTALASEQDLVRGFRAIVVEVGRILVCMLNLHLFFGLSFHWQPRAIYIH